VAFLVGLDRRRFQVDDLRDTADHDGGNLVFFVCLLGDVMFIYFELRERKEIICE
jgi:hypothetical protein